MPRSPIKTHYLDDPGMHAAAEKGLGFVEECEKLWNILPTEIQLAAFVLEEPPNLHDLRQQRVGECLYFLVSELLQRMEKDNG